MTDVIAFDADVLIYAAAKGHALGKRVVRLFEGVDTAGVGSTLLLLESLTKPLRHDPASSESDVLIGLLSRIDLRPVDEPIARLGLTLAARYGLRAADAAHLATAVASGADRFLTNNRKDFPRSISEIDVISPADVHEHP